MAERVKQYQKGDIGTAITVVVRNKSGLVVDISTATTKQIKLKKPDDSVVTKTGIFTTDGTDGKFYYVTTSNDLNQVGTWGIQGYLVMTGFTGHSNPGIFQVLPNFS